MLITADIVLPVAAPPLTPGVVRVEGDRIVAVGTPEELGPHAGEEVIELGSCALAPGLINIHTHLDYMEFKGSINPPKNFVAWIKAINALKRHFDTEDYVRAIRRGFRELMQGGTTSVGNIEAFPEVLPLLEPPPLRVWWFLELIDVRNKKYEEDSVLGALSFFENHRDWQGGFGLSPHAPYTASIGLYRLAKRCSEQFQMPFTTHIAESVDEQQMFVNGTGELFDFMAGMDRDMGDCGHGSALSHLDEHGVLTRDCIAVHLNYLQEYDYETIAHTGIHITHCPKCHSYFGHSPFPMEKLLEQGANICLASDSLASNNELDLRAEIREARAKHPDVPNETWMRTVTANPARALGREGELGVIAPGALADLAAFHVDGGWHDPYDALIVSRHHARMVLVGGKRIYEYNRPY
ncbi:MAG: amidohydrolase family protein [Verrucomicrobiota bacterium]